MTTQQSELEKGVEDGSVTVPCSGCPVHLKIPGELYQRVDEARQGKIPDAGILGRQYPGVFVSPERALGGTLGFSCNHDHYNFALED